MGQQKYRKAGRKKIDFLTGWPYMIYGLFIGLGIAYLIHINNNKDGATQEVTAIIEPNTEEVLEIQEKIKFEDSKNITFDFYDMLPNLDVDIYDNTTSSKLMPESKEINLSKPQGDSSTNSSSIYIIQAGAFSVLEVAEKRGEEIMKLGLITEIKRGSFNNKTVYRVYTAPIKNLKDLNRARTILTDLEIDFLIKKMSE
ncbi:MAG: SPOR domain-containing protein [Pseudomonadota bacterium]|nr:SPOR domain-containing protein [Pseudomonadota bacterium]